MAAWASSTALAAAAISSPSSSPSTGPDPDSVTPGLIGFLATFALVAVCLLLFASLVSRLRRMRYRAEHEDADGRPLDGGDEPGPDGDRRDGDGPAANVGPDDGADGDRADGDGPRPADGEQGRP